MWVNHTPIEGFREEEPIPNGAIDHLMVIHLKSAVRIENKISIHSAFIVFYSLEISK